MSKMKVGRPDNEEHGTYTIEVTILRKEAGTNSNYQGFIHFWLTGGKLGVVDELLYFCANERPGSINGSVRCLGLLRVDNITTMPCCPHCGMPFRNRNGDIQAFDTQHFMGSLKDLSTKVAMHFRNLRNNADIVLVRTRTDTSFHEAELDRSMSPMQRAKMKDMLRSDREISCYTKGRLEKDLAAGGDLVARIGAFLNA